MDPAVTDAVVRDAVGRQRWFWLLLLERGPAVRAGRLRAEVRPWFTTPGDRLPD